MEAKSPSRITFSSIWSYFLVPVKRSGLSSRLHESSICMFLPCCLPRFPQNFQNVSEIPLKMPAHASKMLPRCSQDAPRGSQDALKTVQEAPKTLQRRPKVSQNAPRSLHMAFKVFQEAPKRPQEAPPSPEEAPTGSQEVLLAAKNSFRRPKP